jgi:ATP-binding cassette, subfamily B, bacterial
VSKLKPRRSLLYGRIAEQARACRGLLAGVFLLSLASTPLALLAPVPLKIAVDALTNGHVPQFAERILPQADPAASGVLSAVGIMLCLGMIVNVQGMFNWRLGTITGETLVWNLRAKLLNHVQTLPMSFHDREGKRDSAYRIQHDAPAIQYVLLQGLLPLITASGTLISMLVVCAHLDLQLAAIALAIVPPLFFLGRASSDHVRSNSALVKQLDSTAIGVVEEVLSSIRVIKAFGQEKREHQRFIRHSSNRVAGQVKLATMQGVYSLLIGMTIAVGNAVALYVGVEHVRAGRITIGELLMIMAYIVQVYEPLRLLTSKVTELQVWLASLDRAFALLDERSEIEETTTALPLDRARGEFDLVNVSFRYVPRHRGLRNLSFHVPPGSRVGIVGGSGAGKTTLVNLLMRFYDAQHGSVRLDGHDVRDYRISDLRRQFSVVLQEPLLFAASIAENIAYGNPEASDTQIVAAAKAAGAHEFITNLADGYATMLGESGNRLSGGERQRISLARAFLRDSPILVLDEPTSALDLQTEAVVADAMERLMQGRTTFMIAHRVSTLKHCDMVLRLEGGELKHMRTQGAQEYLREYAEAPTV